MRHHAAAAIASLLVFPIQAYAQEATIEGPGVEVSGGSVFHPSAGVEAGVDTNVFREEDDAVTSPLMRVFAAFDAASRPEARLQGSQSPQKLKFRAGVRFTYSEYLTSNDAAQAQRDVGINANVAAQAFPQGKVTFEVKDSFTRDVRPRNFESTGSIDRDINHFLIAAGLQPGGGALYFGARYENLIDFFESEDARFANRIQHTVGARASWQYLPLTKFYLDGSFGIYDGLGSQADEYKTASTPLRLMAGAASALTARTTLNLRAGFAKGFYESGPDYTSPIVGAEFGLRYVEHGRIKLSYEYDYRDSINANFYRDHAFALGVTQEIDRLILGAKGETRLRRYGGIPDILGGGDREDVIFAAIAELRYALTSQIALTADYRFTIDETDYRSMLGGIVDDPSYVKHEAFAGASASF